MKENQLRELLRKEIRAQLNENDFLKNVSGTVRSALGSKKQQFATGLDKMDAAKIQKMPADKKAELVAAIVSQMGLTADDYNDIRMKIAKKLGVQDDKTMNEIGLGIPPDDYLSVGQGIAAALMVLVGTGLLARHEMKKAQKEVEDNLDIEISDKAIADAGKALAEQKRLKESKKSVNKRK